MLLIASFAAFVHGASRPTISLLFGLVVGTLGSDDPSNMMDEVLFITYAMLVVAGIIWIAGTLWFYLFTRVAVSVSYRVQQAYLNSVLSKDIEWFDHNDPAEVATRLFADIEKIESAIANKAGNFVVGFSQAICGILLGFARGWQITLVVCGCIPLIAIGRVLTTSSSKNLAMAAQSMYAKAGSVAEEVLLSIRTVAAFGQEQREVDRYNAFLALGRKDGQNVAFKVGIATAIMMASMFACYGIAIYVGGYLIEREVFNSSTQSVYQGSDIYVVLTACVMSGFALGQLGPSVQAFSEGTAAFEKLYQVIETESVIEVGPNKMDQSIVASTMAASEVHADETIIIDEIKFDRVFFRYPSRFSVTALNRISFVIKAGQNIGLVGESGSGKSTVIALLERFYDPIDGTISINGIDIKRMDPKLLRRLFGYVGQEPVLFAASIRHNLVYGLDETPSDAKMAKILKMANVDSFLKTLPEGLDTYCGAGGSQMSGGQKQRIAIARALLRDPQVLLLDEATSALDNESEKQVQATIDYIQAKSQLTTISVAHRLSTIKTCDVIFVMRSGGVLEEQGTHEELSRRETGLYHKLISSHGNTIKQANLRVLTRGSGSLKPVKQNYSMFDLTLSSIVVKTQNSLEKIEVEDVLEEERIRELIKGYSLPYRRLSKFVRGDRWLLLPGLVASLFKGLSFPLHSLLFSLAIGYYYLADTSEMLREIQTVSILYAVLAVLVFASIITSIFAFSRIGEGFTMRMRSACFRHILSQDMSFFDDPDHAPTRLMVSLSSWAHRMNVLAGPVVSIFLEFLAAMISGLVIAFLASPKLTGILMTTLPLLIMGIMVAIQGSKLGSNVHTKQASVIASEALQNMRTIRALTAERATERLFDFHATMRVNSEAKEGKKSALLFGFASALLFVPYAIGFYVGGQMVSDGEITMEQMAQVLLGLVFTSIGAGSALAYLPDIQMAKAAAHDVFELLDTESKINPFGISNEAVGNVDLVQEGSTMELEWRLGDGAVRFDNVWFAYPQRPDAMILRGLSIEIKAGSKVALVGPSGGGKSTIMALLLRYYDPGVGSVSIGGTCIKNMDVATLRSYMGYVGQEPMLFDTTMEENVKYGNPLATAADLERVKSLAKLDFIDRDDVAWDTKLGPRGSLLSGGQKQRTAIARALIRDPKILLLDEATSALDPENEAIVQSAIDSVTIGRTTFIIAHRLVTIQDSDLILVIANGKLAEKGTHAELMVLHGIYYDLYRKGKH